MLMKYYTKITLL